MGKRKRSLRAGAFGLTLGVVLVGPASADPVGDETFEGSFSCLQPSASQDKAPIVCQSQINPGLPVLDLSIVWHEDTKSHQRLIDRIDIHRAGDAELLQSIVGIDLPLPPAADNAGIEMLDLNFDGYLDMRVAQAAGAGKNARYRNWLWSKEDGKFVASPGLDAIASPKFNAEDEEIVSQWRSSATESGTDIYAYEGMVPVLAHREADRSGANGSCVRTFYDRIDDQLKATGTGACDKD